MTKTHNKLDRDFITAFPLVASVVWPVNDPVVLSPVQIRIADADRESNIVALFIKLASGILN
jgi:hypothetical protein